MEMNSSSTEKVSGVTKVVAIIICILLIIGAIIGSVVSVENRAITMEEQIGQFHSNLGAQYQRRFDLYTTLAEAVNAARATDDLMVEIALARSAANGGNFVGAEEIINNVHRQINVSIEAYPELRSHESYQIFMREAPMTENQIARYRESFNNAIRSYRSFVRRFPNRSILNLVGYEVIHMEFLEFEQQGQGPPTGLFDRSDSDVQ
jgi:LemA protein